ncbi:hypothetical protein K1719_037583 [Acacia pycnantha]|nr:hypothetical protein K1719_037583 [Acacia pycnantha]
MDKSWIKRPRSSLRQLHERGAGSGPVFFENDAAREFFSLMDESDRPLYQADPVASGAEPGQGRGCWIYIPLSSDPCSDLPSSWFCV